MKKIRDILIIVTLIFIGAYFIFWGNNDKKEEITQKKIEMSQEQKDELKTHLNQVLKMDAEVKEMIDWVKSGKMKYEMKEIQSKNNEIREYYKKNIENNDNIPLSIEKGDTLSFAYMTYKENDSSIKSLFNVKDVWEFTVESKNMEQFKWDFKKMSDYLTEKAKMWFLLKSETSTVKAVYDNMLNTIDSMWREQNLNQDDIIALRSMVQEKFGEMYKKVTIIDNTQPVQVNTGTTNTQSGQ